MSEERGPKYNEAPEKRNGDRNGQPLKKSPDSHRGMEHSSSAYSQSRSPVAAHRSSLEIPSATKKKKNRTLERLGGKGNGKKGGIFRRSTDSQIIVNLEECAIDAKVSTSGKFLQNGVDLSNP